MVNYNVSFWNDPDSESSPNQTLTQYHQSAMQILSSISTSTKTTLTDKANFPQSLPSTINQKKCK